MSHTDAMTEPQRELSEALAEANFESATHLIEQLEQIAQDESISDDEIAALMGSDAELIRRALSGQVELTLSDVQMIALTLGAHVSYTVRPKIDREMQAVESSALAAAVVEWSEVSDAFEISPEEQIQMSPQPAADG